MKTSFYFTFCILLNCFYLFSQSGYSYGKKITINSSVVSGTNDLLNFPIVLHFTDPDLRSVGNGGNVESINGHDIIFTTDVCASNLHHQIESYNPITGEIICWIRIPILSASANTIINMYYGNSTVLTSTSSQLTWNNNYSSVLHLNNDPSNPPPQMIDGSGNTNSGTCIGSMSSINSVNGKIGSCVSFDEINDGITIPDFNYNQAFTISFWFNVNEVNGTSFQYFFSHGNFGTFNSINIYLGEDLLAYVPDRQMLKTIFQDDNDATSTSGHDAGTGYVDGNWHYYTFVVGTLGGAIVYIDGVQIAEITYQGGNPYNPGTNIYLGCRSDLNATRFYGGKLDEFRILNVPLSPDWIATEYNNQNNPTTNFTIEPEEISFAICPTLLPIELISFDGKNIDGKNKLEWTTATERNNDYFTIERSLNAIDFEPLKNIDGAGNSTVINSYEYFDEFPFDGETYYRLKQTDFDGEKTFSQIISIYNHKSSINFYPNPVEDIININVTENTSMSLFNLLGEELKTFDIVAGNNTIDVSNLPSGVYILQDVSGTFSCKVVKD